MKRRSQPCETGSGLWIWYLGTRGAPKAPGVAQVLQVLKSYCLKRSSEKIICRSLQVLPSYFLKGSSFSSLGVEFHAPLWMLPPRSWWFWWSWSLGSQVEVRCQRCQRCGRKIAGVATMAAMVFIIFTGPIMIQENPLELEKNRQRKWQSHAWKRTWMELVLNCWVVSSQKLWGNMGFGCYPISLGINNTFNLQPGIPAPDADLQVAWRNTRFCDDTCIIKCQKSPSELPQT